MELISRDHFNLLLTLGVKISAILQTKMSASFAAAVRIFRLFQVNLARQSIHTRDIIGHLSKSKQTILTILPDKTIKTILLLS